MLATTFIYDTRAEWELVKLREQLGKGGLDDSKARDQLMTLAREAPGSQASVLALLFMADRWPETAEAEVAIAELRQAFKTASIDDLASCFDQDLLRGGKNRRSIASVLKLRVEQEPDHPRAAKLLAAAAGILMPPNDSLKPSKELLQIAELVQKRYATSPELVNFCEIVSCHGRPLIWTQSFEPHVRHILNVNPDRFVQCAAHFALASIVRSGGIERQEEARNLYREFLARFDATASYNWVSAERLWRQRSESILEVIETHGLGMLAPETDGVGLDGESISLNDYRGQVVLVSFWATWCGPCMTAIPHERGLLMRFGTAEFAILGMNADRDVAKARAAVKDHDITWRSLWTREDRFVNNWTVSEYPTFYLLDRNHFIKRQWTGLPSGEELEDAVRGLINES